MEVNECCTGITPSSKLPLKFHMWAAAFDLRIMVGSSPTNGFFPVAIYARRARRALPEQLIAGKSSWDILGTNLSVKVCLP